MLSVYQIIIWVILNLELCCSVCYRLVLSGLCYMAIMIFNSCIDPWNGSWLFLQLLSTTLVPLFYCQVVPVSYVRFSTSPVLYTHTRESLKAFPLGIALTFTVHFHASTGEALQSSSSHLTFSTNRSVTQPIGSSTLIILFLGAAVIYWYKCIHLCILCETMTETWLLERRRREEDLFCSFLGTPRLRSHYPSVPCYI